ncbi:hypothetical protein JBF11_02970 [Taurinivorans muris]|jgi:hypothetical protein|uniref:Uncharacterized protein n=1 Tax=Taurinivorans muris TaxID=2787751 RepID=A0ABY5Y465_9BACT|nr:hypothetical protein JBF11_02970 [Desulfovibrionaceae bacterium LT0009]HBV41369.1 hypothetical protein [Desulfovibrio sp.]
MKKFFIAFCLCLSACSTSHTYIEESPFTMSNWRIAIENRNAERYELAYQYYSLALSSARTEPVILRLKSEMEALERTIHAMR